MPGMWGWGRSAGARATRVIANDDGRRLGPCVQMPGGKKSLSRGLIPDGPSSPRLFAAKPQLAKIHIGRLLGQTRNSPLLSVFLVGTSIKRRFHVTIFGRILRPKRSRICPVASNAHPASPARKPSSHRQLSWFQAATQKDGTWTVPSATNPARRPFAPTSD